MVIFSLHARAQLKTYDSELSDAQRRVKELEETLVATRQDCSEMERAMKARCLVLEDRVESSTREKDLLHEESGKVGSNCWEYLIISHTPSHPQKNLQLGRLHLPFCYNFCRLFCLYI